MLQIQKTYQSPPDSGRVVLGRTIPSLLDEACETAPNHQAFNRWADSSWRSLSHQDFRTTATAYALGLLSLGLEAGDRVALLMFSDINFCLVDIACLSAGLVDVPIDLTQTLEQIIFVLRHSEAKALIISDLDLLAQITPYLWEAPNLQQIIVADVPVDWAEKRSQWLQPSDQVQTEAAVGEQPEIPEATALCIPRFLHPAHVEPPQTLSQDLQLLSLAEVQQRGTSQETNELIQQLRATLKPSDLATIIYIPDEAAHLQGVMLTHENLSMNAIAAFSGIADLRRGSAETVLSFLPLNHVLARTMLYGHILYGHSIYFSSTSHFMKHLKEVQPTILVTVPIVLEKLYSKILEKGSKEKFGLTRLIFAWALRLAQHYELGGKVNFFYALALKVADWLVLEKWRSLLGGRLKYVICGGAALKAELATVFTAAGIPILHGYGLTQASAVVCCNRGTFNRAGTVGVPIAGVEVAIAADQEILVRGPCITSGYYKNPEATNALLDEQGWLHTGDLGTFTEAGFLQITGLKKALFKLATGKYIAPQPIEEKLQQSPLVAQAVAIGSAQKFCAALIVPDLQALHSYALGVGIDLPVETLLRHPHILALYQALVDTANCHLPYWATVKRFQLLNQPLTVENGLLTPDGRINRMQVNRTFAAEIGALYGDGDSKPTKVSKTELATTDASPPMDASEYPPVVAATCPAFAQSLPRINRLIGVLFSTSLTLPHIVSGFQVR